MSQNPECGTDTAAYVLGALEGPELATFQRHLKSCSVCEAEVESLQQLANALPMAAPQFPASKQLRRRVMTEVRADARAQRRTSRRQSLPTGVPRGYMPHYRPGLVGAGAALALVLVVVLVGVTVGGSKTGGRVYSASVGSGELVVNAGHGELIVHHMRVLDKSHTYEVWLERSGGSPQPTPVLFNVSANGDGDVPVPESLQGISEVLVTKEPAGGKAIPTTRPLVVTRIN